MILTEPKPCKPTAIKALIITLSPLNLRSSVLLEAHQKADWLDSSICLGVPKGNSRADLEQEIAKVGLPIPPDHVYDILSRSEVGCIYAHLKALSIASRSESPTLILEDDAHFDPDQMEQILKDFEWLPDDAILKLEGDSKPGGRIILGPKDDHFLYALSMRPSNGSVAYVVTPKSAARLLVAGYGYGHAYDMLLNDPTLHGCFLLDAVPFPVRPAEQTKSLITRGNKRPGLRSKLARHREKLKRRLGRYFQQIRRAKEARFSRIRFAKFYEN